MEPDHKKADIDVTTTLESEQIWNIVMLITSLDAIQESLDGSDEHTQSAQLLDDATV